MTNLIIEILILIALVFIINRILALHTMLHEWYFYWRRVNQEGISKAGSDEEKQMWANIREKIKS